MPIEKLKNLKKYRNEEKLDFEDIFANVEAKFSVKLRECDPEFNCDPFPISYTYDGV